MIDYYKPIDSNKIKTLDDVIAVLGVIQVSVWNEPESELYKSVEHLLESIDGEEE